MTVDRFENILGIPKLDVVRRRVFLRTDLNTPMSPYGAVLDDTALRLALPTIRELRYQECKVVLASTFGSPQTPLEPFRLNAIATRLSELLGVVVTVCEPRFRATLCQMKDGDVTLFPNLLDFPEDQANDQEFARNVAQSVDVYINDSLRICDQESATLDALPRMLPCKGAGVALDRELRLLSEAREGIEPPYTLIVGGDQLTDKLPLIRALLPAVHKILLGGVPAATLLAQLGWGINPLDIDTNAIGFARELLEISASRDLLTLQKDFVVQRAYANEVKVVDVAGVTPNDRILDIGPDTRLDFRECIVRSRGTLWVGTMGQCTDSDTTEGTRAVGIYLLENTQFVAVADAPLVRAVDYLGLADKYKLVSQGDSASLALLSGARLPGIESLRYS